MNHRKYLNSAALKTNPLCGISKYKDTLNLATGLCTRQIKKLVLDGMENWNYSTTSQAFLIANVPNDYDNTLASEITTVCTHYKCIRNDTGISGMVNNNLRLYAKITSPVTHELYIKDTTYTSAADFKSYLAAQYAAGTPVTIWYVLATPTTETISLPSGLSGTLEGSLTQSGTPTPSDPIYPTAVTGEGWYNINTYKRSVLVWNTDTAYERDSGAWT